MGIKLGSYRYFTKKYTYYRDWFKDMSVEERKSIIGRWVLERVYIFNTLLTDIDKEIGIHNRNAGNYGPNS